MSVWWGWMGTCEPRVSTSRLGGETTAASHREDSLDKEGKKETE